MKKSVSSVFCLLTLCLAAKRPFAEPTQAAVHIITRNGGYTLMRNGQPFFIKGAGGGSQNLDEAAARGANSIREWSVDEGTLERVHQLGMTALVGLALGIPRQGFDYSADDAVHKQLEKTIATVHRLKSNPAVLLWALGNELELNATDEQRIAAWKAVEQLAQAVKREDPNHPVIAVLAGPGRTKLRELDQYCPTLDAVGINTYGGILNLPETIAKQGFRRPYIVTEFGPRGHWEVAKTAWGMPIEDTSSQKAALIAEGYKHSIANRPQCLGSYVFLWGHKQEKTQTWYGLFLENGSHVAGVDTMQYLWTGQWPAHRAPNISGIVAKAPDAAGERAPGVFRPGTQILCSVRATDPDGDPITVKWELRPDVANNPSHGGDFEPPAALISGAVEQQNQQSAVIRIPQSTGDYRVFAYASTPFQAAATANLPIRAK